MWNRSVCVRCRGNDPEPFPEPYGCAYSVGLDKFACAAALIRALLDGQEEANG